MVVYRADGAGFAGLTGIASGSATINVEAGTTYYVQGGDTQYFISGCPNTFALNVSVVPPPSNDNFADAIPFTSVPFSDSKDLTGATIQPGEPLGCGGNVTGSAWYAFTPTVTGSYGSPDRGVNAVNVYSGTSLSNLTVVDCSDWFGVFFAADAGTTYYLQYYGGGMRIDALPPPAADFRYTPDTPTVFDDVSFSYDNGGYSDPTVTGWSWDFGDGTTASGQTVSHRYETDGDYSVTLTVAARGGRTNSQAHVVQVRAPDTTPPELWSNDMSLVAISPEGAPVEFAVTATDENPPEPIVYCTPASGSVFPIGVTTVTCSATDDAGNTATTTFNVTVTRPQDEYLHGSGATLTLDMFLPTSSSAKYSDSGGVHFAGGNPWIQVGSWSDPSTVMHGWTYKFNLWAGLKNSDDQGAVFDLRADVYVNGTLAGTNMTRAVTGLTRNPSLAQFVTVRFGMIGTGKPAFLEPGDSISLVLLTRIGTNPDGTKYPGHTNATGLRVYYDSVDRPTNFKTSG